MQLFLFSVSARHGENLFRPSSHKTYKAKEGIIIVLAPCAFKISDSGPLTETLTIAELMDITVFPRIETENLF